MSSDNTLVGPGSPTASVTAVFLWREDRQTGGAWGGNSVCADRQADTQEKVAV